MGIATWVSLLKMGIATWVSLLGYRYFDIATWVLLLHTMVIATCVAAKSVQFAHHDRGSTTFPSPFKRYRSCIAKKIRITGVKMRNNIFVKNSKLEWIKLIRVGGNSVTIVLNQ